MCRRRRAVAVVVVVTVAVVVVFVAAVVVVTVAVTVAVVVAVAVAVVVVAVAVVVVVVFVVAVVVAAELPRSRCLQVVPICLASAFNFEIKMSGLDLVISRELANNINQSRPSCPFFNKGRYCKFGQKCKFMHYQEVFDTLELPHVSLHKTSDDGLLKMNLRPPWQRALQMYYKYPDFHIGNGTRMSEKVYKFTVPYMIDPNNYECVAANLSGVVEINPHNKCYKSGRLEHPKVLMHGTSVKQALDIIWSRNIDPAGGPCGKGIYATECPSFDRKDLLKTFEELVENGSNKGACFVLSPKGMFTNRMQPYHTVPNGVISFKESNGTYIYIFVRPGLCCIYAFAGGYCVPGGRD